MAADFLGLDPGEWTAVGTVALALVTGCLAAWTWRTARMAKNSAADSAAAAHSAQQAAVAARTANEIHLAQLPIDFSVRYTLIQEVPGGLQAQTFGDVAQLTVTCEASTVYFHELHYLGSSGVPTAGSEEARARDPRRYDRPPLTDEERRLLRQGIEPIIVCPPPLSGIPLSLPQLLHKGESVTLAFPHQPLEVKTIHTPRVEVGVIYSRTEGGDLRTIKRDVCDFLELGDAPGGVAT